MKIALVQSPMFNMRMPQLGPAYLKSNLERNGHQVTQFDFNAALYNSVNQDNKRYWNYEFGPIWAKSSIYSKWPENSIYSRLKNMRMIKDIPFLSKQVLENWAKDIIKSSPDLVGFTIYYTSVNTSILLAKKIKQLDRNKKIIFGGPFILCFLDTFQDRIININVPIRNILDSIDMVAVGEGEEIIPDVMKRLEDNGSMKGCQGIIAKENDFLIINNLRPLIKDLDSLHFPDFSILDSCTFTDRNFLPILATRGCPNRCAFCDFPYLDRYKFRIREAKNVVEEIKFQIERYGTELFHFNDALINANLGFLSELCDLIIEENISIRWGASASISDKMDRYLFDKMKQSGCEYLSIGIESASEKVLRDMKKFFTVETIKRNIIDCHNAGISVCTNWIIGYFSEDDNDFEQTLNFITENARYINEIDTAFSTIKPHTYVYENHQRLGICLDSDFNWHTLDNRNNYGIRSKRLEKLRHLQKDFAIRINDRIGGLRE